VSDLAALEGRMAAAEATIDHLLKLIAMMQEHHDAFGAGVIEALRRRIEHAKTQSERISNLWEWIRERLPEQAPQCGPQRPTLALTPAVVQALASSNDQTAIALLASADLGPPN